MVHGCRTNGGILASFSTTPNSNVVAGHDKPAPASLKIKLLEMIFFIH